MKTKKYLSKIGLAILALSFFFAQSALVYACGISMIPSAASGWAYGNDSAEQSFINYQDGIEHLIISRTFENESADTVWIIPIPAAPDSINVDVLSESPKFFGYDIILEAEAELKNIRKRLLSTQIYPAVPGIIASLGNNALGLDGMVRSAGSLGVPGGTAGVRVYEHIEKDGMIAEVLSASDSDALYDYLQGKGLNAEKDSISIFQDYIGKDFSFVAAWISPSAETVQAKGVLMKFPADKIFYPLKPGSAYPGEGMPETITVVGHVTPELYSGIKDFAYVDYYRSYRPLNIAGFYSSGQEFNYTKIVVDAPPQNLTEDLHISSKAPLRVIAAVSISERPFVHFILLLALISLISSYAASRLLLADRRFGTTIKMAVAGSFTLLGTIIGSRFFLAEKRWKFVLAHSVVFVLATLALLFLFLTIFS